MLNPIANFVGNVPDEALSGTVSLLSLFSFWSFIIIAATATVLVFIAAVKMKGGLFSGVLRYFGAGMTLVLFGFVLVAVPSCVAPEYAKIINDVLYTVGYVLMAVAAHRLYAFTKAT